MPKKPRIHTVGVRLTADETKIVRTLKEILGVATDSDILRMGLRALAREHKTK